MLDTHVVARSFTDARVHAVESSPANATTRPPWPIGLNPLPRLPWSRRRQDGAPEPCPPRRRMVADSRTVPAVGTSDRRHAAQRHAAIDGADWRHDGRDTLSVPRPRPAGHRGSRGAGAPSRTRSVARPPAWPSDTLTGGPVRRLASTSRPTTAAASPGRSPRPPSSGTGSAPPPPARGRRRMADAPSAPGAGSVVKRCGAEWLQRRWQTRRPPPPRGRTEWQKLRAARAPMSPGCGHT